jgi:hypothetical protein
VKKKELIISPAYEWVDKLDIDPPMPAKNYIPEWYRNIFPYRNKECKNILFRLPVSQGNETNMTAKMCLPLLDSITSGYIITMPCDVQFVDPMLYGHRVIWSQQLPWQVISSHFEDQTMGINHFNSDIFEKNAFKFELLWKIKSPKGYSLLYTHPFWNYNLPFFTSTAIVDADNYSEKLNIPFFIKKDFMGVIEKGTPIAQVIPIKRDSWITKKEKFTESYYPLNIFLKLSKSYKKRFWEKKEYN